jgi:hypothetical protein
MNQAAIIEPLPSAASAFLGAQAQPFANPSVLALNTTQGLNYQKKKALKVMALLADLQ